MSLEQKIRDKIKKLEADRSNVISQIRDLSINGESSEHFAGCLIDLHSRVLELKSILKDNGYEV